MQVLTRPKVSLSLGAVLLAVIAGVLFLKTPLEIPSLQVIPVAQIGGYPLRGSVVEQWLAMALLLLVALLATRALRLSPAARSLQNFVEFIVEGFLGLVEGIAGRKNGRRFFPIVMTIFLFVISANWLGLLPGVGTMGTIVPAEEVIKEAEHEGKSLDHVELLVFEKGSPSFLPIGAASDKVAMTAREYEEHGAPEGKIAGHLAPLLRPANTDINTPLALAIWSFIFVEFWGFSTLGPGYLGKFFNFGNLLRGRIGAGFLDIFVGALELVSELIRLVSFTFRLFGNVFAGEVLILLMSFFFPLVFVLLPYVAELFFGAIQAFIFAILTLIFGITAVASHGGEGHAEEAREH